MRPPLAVVLLLLAPVYAQSHDADTIHYVDHELGIRLPLTIPGRAEAKEQLGVLFQAPAMTADPRNEGLSSCMVMVFREETPLAEAGAQMRARLEKSNKVLAETELELGGVEALLHEFEGALRPSVPMHGLALTVVTETRRYGVIAQAYFDNWERDEAALRAALESFRLEPQEPPSEGAWFVDPVLGFRLQAPAFEREDPRMLNVLHLQAPPGRNAPAFTLQGFLIPASHGFAEVLATRRQDLPALQMKVLVDEPQALGEQEGQVFTYQSEANPTIGGADWLVRLPDDRVLQLTALRLDGAGADEARELVERLELLP